jgi:Metal-dependent amidase/aminoacylase/carboxypeptidase
MSIYKEIKTLHDDMRLWRQTLHQYPETAFEETKTAKIYCRTTDQIWT